MRIYYTVALTSLVGMPALAADLNISVEIPRLDVAEYHRPYVAVWVEKADNSVPATLAVWYSLKNREGTKWLKDMRQWWRRAGRSMDVPVDGVTGATKPAGEAKLDASAAVGKLPPGDYRLGFEAAREGGGHEVVYVPFQWPPAQAQQLKAKGESELGALTVDLKP
jgi:hypothetical protein